MSVTVASRTTVKGQTSVGGFSPASLFLNNEQGVWYDPSDMTTMFQDSTGTTPVTLESPVGCILDKRNMSYSMSFPTTNNGSDNLTIAHAANLSFTAADDITVEAWIYLTAHNTYSVIVSKGNHNASLTREWAVSLSSSVLMFYWSANGEVDQTVTRNYSFSLNTWYHVAATKQGSTIRLFVNGTQIGASGTFTTAFNGSSPLRIGTFMDYTGISHGFAGYISNLRFVKGTAIYTANFTPPTAPLAAVSGTSFLFGGNTWSGNPSYTKNGNVAVSGINPFNAGVGNHAYQSTSANRPVLSARVNLLTNTEDVAVSPWTTFTTAGGSISFDGTKVTAPNGTTTATKVTINRSGSSQYGEAYQTFTGTASSYTYSIYLKADSAGDSGKQVAISLYNGTATVTPTLVTLTTDWTQYTITGTLAASASCQVIFGYIGSSDGGGSQTGSIVFRVWGADLRLTNQGVNLPVYQRVGAATYGTSTTAGVGDYDTTNFPMYLKFDGSSDFLSAGDVLDLGTSDIVIHGAASIVGASGTIVGKSAATSATGRWWLTKYLDKYSVNYEGVLFTPRTIEGPTNTSTAPLITTGTLYRSLGTGVLRTNGSQVASGSYTAETTNLGTAYPLLVGAYADAAGTGIATYTNGNIYGVIVRLTQSSNNQIQATENWLNQKTKAYA